MATYQTTWANGPIGPGFFFLFVPVKIVQPSQGGPGGFGRRDKQIPGHVIPPKKPLGPPVDEALALLMLLQHR